MSDLEPDPSDSAYYAIGVYQYNALNWRTSKLTVGGSYGETISDEDPPGSSSDPHRGLKQQRWLWYNAAWQAIAEDVDDDVGSSTAALIHGANPVVPGIDRRVQQFFGLRGINDALYRREDRPSLDPNTEEIHPPTGQFSFAFYQISDPQLSVVATLIAGQTTTGRVAEEVEYDPYGRSRRTAQGDFNRDGVVGVQDIFDLMAAQSAGHIAADENDSGDVSVQDIFDFLAEYFAADPTPRDRISGQSGGWGLIDNPYGYCGYYADAETAASMVLGPVTLISGQVNSGSGCLYHVRHRVYDPIAGRWLTRDPAGFVDGMNLYEYCASQATSCFDPTGLIAAAEGASGWPGLHGCVQQSPGADDNGRGDGDEADNGDEKDSAEEDKSLWDQLRDWMIDTLELDPEAGLEGGHDGLLAWAEGFINAGLGLISPGQSPVGKALSLVGVDLPTFRVDLSGFMYDPNTPFLGVSRTSGAVSFASAMFMFGARAPALPRGGRFTQETVGHISKAGHLPRSAHIPGKGRFNDSLREIKKLAEETVKNGRARPNTNGRPGTIYERDFGRTVGTNGRGQPTSRVRVVVNPDGTIKTLFPF